MITTCVRRMPYVAFAALLILALAPVRANAQSDFDSILIGYTLTMPKVKAWEHATVAAAKALKASLRKAEIENEMSAEGDSFDDMVAKMDAVPEIRRAAHQSRLTTRELVTIGMVLMQAMMADQVLQMSPDAKAPENLNPENLKFVRAHRAELQRSLEAVKAVSAVDG